MFFKSQPIRDEMFLSDDEVEDDSADREKQLGMENSGGDPKALPQHSLIVATKGDLTLKEVTMDNTEVVEELEREDQILMKVIEGKEGLLREKVSKQAVWLHLRRNPSILAQCGQLLLHRVVSVRPVATS